MKDIVGKNAVRGKWLTVLMFLCFELLTSCSEREPQEEGQPKEVMQADTVIMTFQTLSTYSRLNDLEDVLEAINDISIPEIGVRLEVKLVDAMEAYVEYPLWIGRGETIDLMMLNYQDITTYINRNMLLPLNSFLEENGQELERIMQEGYPLTEKAVIHEEAYGVAVVPVLKGSGNGIWIPVRYLEEAGIPYERTYIWGLDELTELFAALKELYPDKYPLGQITANNKVSTFSYYMGNMDSLGGDFSNGVLMTQDSIQVVNLFATREYCDFLDCMRQWYLEGYVYPDAAITDASLQELVEEQIVLTQPLSSQPGMGMEDAFGEKLVCLRTSVVREENRYARSGFWTIPVTSQNPDAAMRFLNLMYGDARIGNLLQWGIEGRHYVVENKELGIITFPDGIDASNSGYYNPLGLYGDRRIQYELGTEELRAEEEIYDRETLPGNGLFKGFLYSTANMETKIDAVQQVIEKYVPILESGSVDLERYYPEFLDKLRQAGIDEVIADKQKQLDAWLAESRQ